MQRPAHANEQPLSHILVIDPEKDIIEFIRSHLRPEDYQVEGCQRGQEGIEMARRIHPDLIILELALPDINGLELCQKLRAGKARREQPVLVLTHLDDAQTRLQAQKAGAQMFMTKPFNSDELLWHIKTLTTLEFRDPAYLSNYEERLPSWVQLLPSWLRPRLAQGPLHFDTCPHCGAEIRSGDNFCLTCGKFLG